MIKWIAMLAVVFLAGCGDNGGSNPIPLPRPAPAGGWNIQWSQGVPPTFVDTFDFPPADGVHYVVQTPSKPIQIGQTITLKFALEGTGRLIPIGGDSSARVRMFLEQAGDQLTAAEPFKRWWSTTWVELTPVPGEFTFTIVVGGDAWQSLFGSNSAAEPQQFANMLTQLGYVGFTFGGDFAGHGVYAVDGPVKFTVKNFTVE